MASNLNLHRICFRRNAGGRYQRAYLKLKSPHRGFLFSAPKKGSKNKLSNSLHIIEKLAKVFGLHMARMQSIYLLNSISQNGKGYIYIPQSAAATKKYNFPHYRHWMYLSISNPLKKHGKKLVKHTQRKECRKLLSIRHVVQAMFWEQSLAASKTRSASETFFALSLHFLFFFFFFYSLLTINAARSPN